MLKRIEKAIESVEVEITRRDLNKSISRGALGGALIGIGVAIYYTPGALLYPMAAAFVGATAMVGSKLLKDHPDELQGVWNTIKAKLTKPVVKKPGQKLVIVDRNHPDYGKIIDPKTGLPAVGPIGGLIIPNPGLSLSVPLDLGGVLSIASNPSSIPCLSAEAVISLKEDTEHKALSPIESYPNTGCSAYEISKVSNMAVAEVADPVEPEAPCSRAAKQGHKRQF